MTLKEYHVGTGVHFIPVTSKLTVTFDDTHLILDIKDIFICSILSLVSLKYFFSFLQVRELTTGVELQATKHGLEE